MKSVPPAITVYSPIRVRILALGLLLLGSSIVMAGQRHPPSLMDQAVECMEEERYRHAYEILKHVELEVLPDGFAEAMLGLQAIESSLPEGREFAFGRLVHAALGHLHGERPAAIYAVCRELRDDRETPEAIGRMAFDVELKVIAGALGPESPDYLEPGDRARREVSEWIDDALHNCIGEPVQPWVLFMAGLCAEKDGRTGPALLYYHQSAFVSSDRLCQERALFAACRVNGMKLLQQAGDGSSKGVVSTLDRFLRVFPAGTRAMAARELRSRVLAHLDMQAYGRARFYDKPGIPDNTRAFAYRGYLEAYPDGAHAGQVMERLRELGVAHDGPVGQISMADMGVSRLLLSLPGQSGWTTPLEGPPSPARVDLPGPELLAQ